MSRLVLAVLALAGVYVLVLGTPKPLDAVAGLLVGTLLVAGLRDLLFGDEPPRPPSLPARLLASPLLALAVTREVAHGTWQVLLISLGLRDLREPGVVEVPIAQRSEAGVVATTLLATLSPGELLVDVDRERGVMLMHVMDARDPDAVRRRYETFYERYQRRVFP